MVTPENIQKALDTVISYCEGIIRLEGSPSDEEIQVCEKVLEMINDELTKK